MENKITMCNNSQEWLRKPLVFRLEELRQENCFDSCEQSNSTINKRSSENQTLIEAINFIENNDWQNSALRVGEKLSSTLPKEYYNFSADQWLEWVKNLRNRSVSNFRYYLLISCLVSIIILLTNIVLILENK